MKNLYLVGELVGGQASERVSARESCRRCYILLFLFFTLAHTPGLLYLPFMHLITNNVGD